MLNPLCQMSKEIHFDQEEKQHQPNYHRKRHVFSNECLQDNRSNAAGLLSVHGVQGTSRERCHQYLRVLSATTTSDRNVMCVIRAEQVVGDQYYMYLLSKPSCPIVFTENSFHQ